MDFDRPKRLNAHTIIDLSEQNVDGIINSPGSVQVVPTTIMKAGNIGFTKGRRVAITSNWIAYALPRGEFAEALPQHS